MTRFGFHSHLALALLLMLAAALQGMLAYRLSFLGGQPDFVFIVAMAGALLSGAGLGSVLGLIGGLLTAALVGDTVGTYLVSRTIAGFVAGGLAGRMFGANAGVVALSIAAASAAAEVVYFLSAPSIGLERWLVAAIVGTFWNALLGVPVAFLLRRFGWGRDRE